MWLSLKPELSELLYIVPAEWCSNICSYDSPGEDGKITAELSTEEDWSASVPGRQGSFSSVFWASSTLVSGSSQQNQKKNTFLTLLTIQF